MLLSLLFLFFGADQVIQLNDIFQPLDVRHVAVAADGEIYVVNPVDPKLFHITLEGSVNTFSGKGVGPGEMENPWSIQLFGETLYVIDFIRGPMAFTRKGEFIKRMKMPRRFLRPLKVIDGWVFTVDPFQKDEPSSLYWCDDEGENMTMLAAYPNIDKGMSMDVKEDNTVHLDYNPAPDKALLFVSDDGLRLTVYLPGATKIAVYDMDAKVVVNEWAIGRNIRSFPNAWGEDKVAALKNNVYLNGKLATTVINRKFPEVLPLITNMMPGPAGHWWVATDEALFNPDAPLVILDQAGKQTKTAYTSALMGRLVKILGDQGVVLSFDRTTGNARLDRLGLDQLNAHALKHTNTETDEKDSALHINW